MPAFLLLVSLIGLGWMATMGAWDHPVYQWPAYMVLGLGAPFALFRWNHSSAPMQAHRWSVLVALLFAAWCIGRSFLHSVDPFGQTTATVPYLARPDMLLVLGCVIVYSCVALHAEKPSLRRWLFMGLWLVVAFNCLVGLYQVVRDHSWSPYSWLGLTRAPQEPGGCFYSENSFAGFLVAASFYFPAFALLGRGSVLSRMLSVGLFLLCGLLVVLTTSRGGTAAWFGALLVLMGLGFWLSWRFYGQTHRSLFFGVAVAVAVAGLGAGGIGAIKLKESYMDRDGVLSSQETGLRKYFTMIAVEQWKLSPLIGTGPRTFEHFGRAYTKGAKDWSGANHANPHLTHNDWAQLLGEYGAVGFGLGLLLVLVHLWNGFKYLRWARGERFERTRDPQGEGIAFTVAAMAIIIGYMAISVIDFNLHMSANALLVAVALGLLANPGSMALGAGQGKRKKKARGTAEEAEKAENEPSEISPIKGRLWPIFDKWLRWAFIAFSAFGGGFLLWKSVKAFPAEWHAIRGDRMVQNDQYANALAELSEAQKLDPENYAVTFNRGVAYAMLAEDTTWPVAWRRQNRVKSAEQFHLGTKLYPDHGDSVALLAEQLSLMGGYEEAEKLYRRALSLAPSLTILNADYGRHLMRAGHVEEAKEQWAKTLTMHWYGDEAIAVQSFIQKLDAKQQTSGSQGSGEPPPPPEPPPAEKPPAESAPAEKTPTEPTPPTAAVEMPQPQPQPTPSGPEGVANVKEGEKGETPAEEIKAAEPVGWKNVATTKIWDPGLHCAFTCLVRHKGRFLCAFREGSAHVPGADGAIRLLSSQDGKEWKSVVVLKEDGIDLRDPKLSVTPAGILHLIVGGSVYELPPINGSPAGANRAFLSSQSRVATSADGQAWSSFHSIAKEREWLWRASWNGSTAYAASYPTGQLPEVTNLTLWKSPDGESWQPLPAINLPDGVRTNEVTLRFDEKGILFALVRNEHPDDRQSWWAMAKAPYTKWSWLPASHIANGPDFIKLPTGQWAYGGRDYLKKDGSSAVVEDGTPPVVSIGHVIEGQLMPQLTLPSGGDCGYPGLVWHEGHLWVSYYSTHEGSTAIYVAQVKLP